MSLYYVLNPTYSSIRPLFINDIRYGTIPYRTVLYATVSYRTVPYCTAQYRTTALSERHITVTVLLPHSNTNVGLSSSYVDHLSNA